MYESHLLVQQQQQEADLFQDLSQLIKTFKKIMTLTSQIINNINHQSTPSLINQLKQLPQIHQQLIQHYNYKVDQDSTQKSTINRFICRLYQTLSLYKNNPLQREAPNLLYKQFLDKIQLSVTSYQKEKNIGKVVKKIIQLTQRFCLSCQIIVNHGFQEEILTYFAKNQEQQEDPQSFPNHSPIRKQHFSKTQSNFHKAMNVLNRRFSTVSCLDLDYNSFKSYYFQSRSQQLDLQRQFMQRNALTWKQIHGYSKQFSDYLKRKEKYQLNRKNRLKNRHQSPKKQQNDSIVKGYIRKYNEKSATEDDKELDLPILHKNRQKSESPDKRINSGIPFNNFETRKTHCHIKNIYLNVNKLNPQHNNSTFIDRQHKMMKKHSLKEKTQPQVPFKVAKISFRASKFVQVEKQKHRPLLEIKQLESRNFGFTIDNNSHTQEMNNRILQFSQSKPFKSGKAHISKKSISQKKNIRITQLLNKSSLNTKLMMEDTYGQEDNFYQIKVMNCQDEESSRL